MAALYSSRNSWFYLQTVVWGISFFLVASLFVFPEYGLHAFWDVLIPIAPALFVFFPGLWRNICPVATMSQLPRHIGVSKRSTMSSQLHGWLVFAGVMLLFLIIPLRHTYFDLNGPATGLFLIVASLLAVTLSFYFDGKSGWCASLCPVHQVEKFYGQRPAATMHNSHCHACSKCVTGCPDSTPAPSPHLGGKTWPRRAAAFGLIGAFPGYVWGWFQVQDYPTLQLGIENLWNTYFLPVFGGAITLTIYALFISSIPMQKRKVVDRFFAAAAVSCYYWYRIPWLFGFSQFEGNGMLINLNGVIPNWVITLLPFCSTVLFVWWIALRRNGLRAWMKRPPDEDKPQKPITVTVSV